MESKRSVVASIDLNSDCQKLEEILPFIALCGLLTRTLSAAEV